MLLVHGLGGHAVLEERLRLEFWVLAAITVVSVRGVYKTSDS
jgi:hypothetical protein